MKKLLCVLPPMNSHFKRFFCIVSALALLLASLTLTTFAATTKEAAKKAELTATAHSIPLFGCDLEVHGFTLDEKDFKAGFSSLTYTLGSFQNAAGETVVNDGQASFVLTTEKTLGKESIDVSKMDTLEFWFYISDKDALAEVHFADTGIELTSSGQCDREEFNWRLEDILQQCKQNGWNEIRLHFSNAGKAGSGEIDLTRLNYLRWFFVRASNLPDKPIILKIDNIRLTDYQTQQKENVKPQIAAMAEKIQKNLQDIPEWDEENADLLAQYHKNYPTWNAAYQELNDEIDSWELLAQEMMAENEASLILNRVRRYLRRYETYLEKHPEERPVEQPDPSDKTDETIGADQPTLTEDEKYHSDLRMMGILIVLGALAIVADIVVYRLLRKKKDGTVSA